MKGLIMTVYWTCCKKSMKFEFNEKIKCPICGKELERIFNPNTDSYEYVEKDKHDR